ncbi:MAG: 3-dehydroquinate synthase [Betaproteobacteria bacterium]
MRCGHDSHGNIILAGFMGVGKSSVGGHLAALLGMAHLDTDALIEAETGATISEIFGARGEARFRHLEARAIRRASRLNDTVISVGGGALMDQRNVDVLKRAGILVWLRATPESVLARLRAEGECNIATRPLLAGRADLEHVRSLMKAREDGYRQADLAVDTDGKRPDEIAREIVRRIAQPDVALRRSRAAQRPHTPAGAPGGGDAGLCALRISAGGSTYQYLLGRGIMADPESYRLLQLQLQLQLERTAGAGPPAKAIVVTTPTLRVLFGPRFEQAFRGGLRGSPSVVWAIVPDGERAKTFATLTSLYEACAASGAGRDSVVVALGGGTVGDVAGFLAATYMRGVRLVQVPTTLLAMVDSSIGGKTAINLRAAKNLVGAFWQPTAVIADTSALGTLPLRELASGLAEVVKAAVIGDPDLFEILERVAGASNCDSGDPAAGARRPRGDSGGRVRASRFQAVREAIGRDPGLWQDIIRRAVMVKASIVGTDERDAGARLLLNLGHTLGHAVERAGGFSRWTHGEAVAMGLAAACRASARLGYLREDTAARVIRLLASLGLPTSVPHGENRSFRESVLAAMALDKKARGGKLRIVLPLSIGKCSIFEGSAAEVLAEEMTTPPDARNEGKSSPITEVGRG